LPGLIFYATAEDAGHIRAWINADPDIAWIVKEGQDKRVYHWKAVKELAALRPGEYALWQTSALRLNIPSGSPTVPDAPVLDPFQGWTQTLDTEDCEQPWFGGNLPGPVSFTWREEGREKPDSLARSDFSWLGNRFAAIGKPAHPKANRWWAKLKRFVTAQAVPIQWSAKIAAYAFPGALVQIRSGRHFDLNP
jgi:hypothetical protein